jgi:alternate signal-mediated exported protein
MTGLMKTKKLLLAVLAIGAAAYLGGGGTFASFSAETSNNGSSVSSGTLTMSNKVNAATACMSTDINSTQNNVNPNCNALFALTNVAPGIAAGSAKLTIQNTGSIDATKLFSVSASYVNASLTTALPNGVSSGTTLAVSPLEGAVGIGDTIRVIYGPNSQDFVTTAASAAGTSSITVTAQTANALNFNPTAGDPLCHKLLFYVQETGTGTNYCWYGVSVTTAMCAIPFSANLNAGLSTGGPISSIVVASLNGNIAAGDTLTIAEGSFSQTVVVATGNNYFASPGSTPVPTTITVNSFTPNHNYTTAAVVTDATTLVTLKPLTATNISNFDTSHGPVSGPIPLYPVTSNGVADPNSPIVLARNGNPGYQRTFQVGVYLPDPGNQNFLQGLQSTFGLTFHLDQ